MAVAESMDLRRYAEEAGSLLALPVIPRLTGGLLFMTSLVLVLRISRLLGSSRLASDPGPARGQVTA